MGSVSVSSCRCCMFVSCVHPVAVLNAAFCMTVIIIIDQQQIQIIIYYSEVISHVTTN